MIFAPGSLARTDSARSAVAKSPGTNSPVSSTKKQRSASPSNATPKSAPSSSVSPDDELPVLGQQRVRLVVREGAVRLEVAAHRLDRQALEHRRQHRAGHAVGGVDDDPQRRDRGHVDEGEHLVDERRVDVLVGHGAPALGRRPLVHEGTVADLEQPGLAADGQRALADDLHPRVLLGVVRGGHGDAAVQAARADREVEHLGPHEAELEDVGAAVRRALDHRLRHRRARRGACRGRPRCATPRTAGRRRGRSRTRPPRRSRSRRARARRTP